MQHYVENKILFVEGKNDKGFVKAFINHYFPDKIQFVKIVDMQGISNFPLSLKSESTDIINKPINALGVMIDIDNSTTTEKIEFVNSTFKKVTLFNGCIFNDSLQTELLINTIKKCNVYLYFVKASNGKGELIDVLKETNLTEFNVANCVVNCFNKKGDTTPKEVSDDWLHIYLKWDNCNYNERRNSDNFSLEKVETQNKLHNIFDFSKLGDLKLFLNNFLA